MSLENLSFSVLRKTWQPVALSRDVTAGKILSYTLLDEEIVLSKIDGKILAAKDLCPHRGAKLGLGKIEHGCLICPYHGWEFDADGQCAAIPSLADQTAPVVRRTRLKTFPVRERYGMVWVRLDAGEEVSPLPDVPEFEDENWTYLVAEPMKFAAGFRREIENYLDMSHFAFAHNTSLGVAAAAQIDNVQVTRLADGVRMDAPFPVLETSNELPGKLQQAHHRTQRVFLPNFTTIRQRFDDGDERVLVHIPSPNSPFECTVFWALAISPNFAGPAPEDQLKFAVGVLDEDRIMVENQRPLEVPLENENSVLVPADKFTIAFKHSFVAYLQSFQSAKSAETAAGG